MEKEQQFCYVCRKSDPVMHELNLVHQRVGLGSIDVINVCPKHYEAYQQGQDLVAMEKRNFTKFIHYLNSGRSEEYE